MEHLARKSFRRDDIVRAASLLFEERGYHSTTMEDVAEAVGIKKPTLYHHVPSKEVLLYLIHDEFVDLLLDKQRIRREADEAPDQRLLGVMTDILVLMDTHGSYVRVFFEYMRELTEPYRSAINSKRDAYFDDVVDALRAGVKAGMFQVSDVRLAALAIFGMCNWAHTWYDPGGKHAPEDIAKQFWAWLLSGIGDPSIVGTIATAPKRGPNTRGRRS